MQHSTRNQRHGSEKQQMRSTLSKPLTDSFTTPSPSWETEKLHLA